MIDHMEVASILIQLPQLIASRNRLPLPWPAWGAKRKRSAEENSFMRRLRLPSPALQYSFQDVAGPVVLESEKPAGKVEATSPATPLSFSPSESDEKRNRFKSKLSVKKKKEELLEIQKECTITNELLKKEIEQTKHYLMQLEAQNLSLQERKQELMEENEKENLKLGELGQEEDGDSNNKVEASGIPDLNVALPVWMGFDDNKSYAKAMAAQARQRRMVICRDKNLNVVTKLRISRK